VIEFATPRDLIARHWASITDQIEEKIAPERDPFAFDPDGDYIGMLRECACGELIEGYYEYALHLSDVLESGT
jgi:hypothetical protein